MPAPMIAPIPSVIRFTGPSARFRLCSPVSPASCISVSIDFVANKGLPMQLLLFLFLVCRNYFSLLAALFSRLHNQYTGSPNSTITIPRPAVCVL